MTTVRPFSAAAYRDGVDAALRIGRYKGATHNPRCPYPSGTQEHDDWLRGFSDANEEMWIDL